MVVSATVRYVTSVSHISLPQTSVSVDSWGVTEKSKNYHNQTSSAFHIVCRTACSLYLSVLRHNVILNIQLNQGDETGWELCVKRTIPPLMPLPFDLATHSFFVN